MRFSAVWSRSIDGESESFPRLHTRSKRWCFSAEINGFYSGKEALVACCQVRKIEPFRRAISDFSA
jgi:3'-phosphoadenosine 5'-phosphosulfate sulfotransferase (PAPS reductase)/FAD synthetase